MKFKPHHLIYLCFPWIWISCNVQKQYSRPELGLPEVYRDNPIETGQKQQKSDTLNPEILKNNVLKPDSIIPDPINLDYRAFFKDPLLVGLIDLAIAKNYDLAIAARNMEQAKNLLQQAKAVILPQLNLVAAGSRSYQSKNSLNGSLSQNFVSTKYIDDYNAAFSLSWEADLWGRIGNGKRAAAATFLGQQQAVALVRAQVIAQIAQGYYNLLTLDEQLKVARKNAVLSDSTLSIIRLQYDAGQVNSLAVLQASAQKQTAELLVPLALQNIVAQENALSILTGQFPEAIQRKRTFSLAEMAGDLPAGIPAELLQRRPDVKQAELSLMAANANVGIAKASLYPKLSITAQSGLNSFTASNWFNLPASLFNTFAGNLTQPVLQGRQLKTQYKNALLEQEKSTASFKQSVLKAVAEVSDALAITKGNTSRYEIALKRYQQLEKATHDAQLLFKSGLANYLEVITAQNNLLQSQIELTGINGESLKNKVDLYKALGGGA